MGSLKMTRGRILTTIGGVLIVLVVTHQGRGTPGPVTQAFDLGCLLLGLVLSGLGLKFHLGDADRPGPPHAR